MDFLWTRQPFWHPNLAYNNRKTLGRAICKRSIGGYKARGILEASNALKKLKFFSGGVRAGADTENII